MSLPLPSAVPDPVPFDSLSRRGVVAGRGSGFGLAPSCTGVTRMSSAARTSIALAVGRPGVRASRNTTYIWSASGRVWTSSTCPAACWLARGAPLQTQACHIRDSRRPPSFPFARRDGRLGLQETMQRCDHRGTAFSLPMGGRLRNSLSRSVHRGLASTTFVRALVRGLGHASVALALLAESRGMPRKCQFQAQALGAIALVSRGHRPRCLRSPRQRSPRRR